MADIKKNIIVKLDLQGIKGSDQKLGELDQQIARLSKRQKQLKKETKGGTAASAEQKKEAGNLTKRLANLRQEKSKLTRQTKKLNEGQKANTRTIAGLRERNRALVAEMNRLDISTQKGQARLKLLRQEFLANDQKVRQFDQSLGRHQANVGNYRSGLAGAKAGLTAMAAGITAAVMAFQRINAMMRESVELFKTQELAERQLTFAVGDGADALIEQAAALQQQTTFGDEATIQMQAMLASFGSTTEQIKTLTPLILDYAAASGKDLSTASTQLNNILNGTSTTLRGTSIRLSETATSAERYEAVLQELNKYQGSAAALADTQAGRLDQLTNAYNDQREELGGKLIPIQIAFMEGTMSTIEAVSELVKFLNENKRAIATLAVTTTAYGAIQARNLIATTAEIAILKLKTAWDNRAAIAQKVLNISMINNPIGLVVVALTALVTWLATSEKGMEFFRTAFDKVSQGVEWLKANILNLLKVAFFPYVKGLELVTNGLNKLGLISDDTAGKITNLTAINFKQVESTKAAGAGWNNLTAAIERTKEVEQRLAEDRAAREREENKRAQRESELHERKLKEQEEERKRLEKLAKTEKDAAKELELFRLEQNIKRLEDKNASDEEIYLATVKFLTREKELLLSNNELTSSQRLLIEEKYLAKVYEAHQKLREDLDELAGEKIDYDDSELFNIDPLEERIGKVQAMLTALKGISLNDAMMQFAAMTEETTKFEKTLVAVGASVTAINQVLDTRFANQKAKIEQQTLAEKEAIEQSTMSEEQKRIAIERAEQKKATALEKIERQQAKKQKANAIIQSLINTALAITQALSNTILPFPLSLGAIAPIAAIGAVQTGIIAAQQFAEGGQVAELGTGEGGVIAANLQNIPALPNGDNVLATVKTGEVILNDAQQNRLMQLTSPDIFRAIKVPNFADGGVVPSFQSSQQASTARIEAASQNVADTVQRIRVVNVASDTQGMAVRVQNIEGEASIG
jgi:hypothetical protein